MLPELYQGICERLAERVPELKWIDRYAQQPQRRDEMYSYDLPAVFIDEERTDWDTLGEGVQHGRVSIRLFVEQRNAGDSHYTDRGAGTPEPAQMMEVALRRDRLLAKIHRALQGLEIEDISTPLTRRREEPDEAPGTTYEDLMVYECSVTVPGYDAQLVDAEPVVDMGNVAAEPEVPVEDRTITSSIRTNGQSQVMGIPASQLTYAEVNPIIDNLSFSFWLEMLTLPAGVADAWSFGYVSGSKSQRINIRFEPHGAAVPIIGNGAQQIITGSSIPLQAGLNHIAYNRNGNDLDVYLNGSLNQTITVGAMATAHSPTNTNALQIGRNISNVLDFAQVGVADNIILNGSFTSEDIAELYRLGCGNMDYEPVGGSIVSRVHFNEVGTTQTDVSGNGHDVVLSDYVAPVTLSPGTGC